MKRFNKQKGFTLIELLVVVVIITVLGMIGLTSYRNANVRSRNARRAADTEQVRAALEMFRLDDAGNLYPATVATMIGTHITAEPTDPLTNAPYLIYNPVGGTTYTLCYTAEPSGNVCAQQPL